MQIYKNQKFKIWLILLISLAILLSLGFYLVRNNLRQSIFSELQPTTQELKEQLDGGASPNGSLSRVFYNSYEADLSNDLGRILNNPTSHSANFGIIIEETKSYFTSSAKLDSQIPVPPAEYLAKTKIKGNNQLVWHIAKGKWVAIDSLTYHYGDVFGYVISGQSANAYLVKLLLYSIISTVVWLTAAVLSYRLIFKPATKRK
jgi:hypothetical protein